MNTLRRLLDKMRSRSTRPTQPYQEEFEYAVHLMADRLGAEDPAAIAAVNAILAEGHLDLSQLIHHLRHAQDIPVGSLAFSQRLNRRFYQSGSFVGFGGFSHEPARPIACEGCRNYYGQGHGRIPLVCAIHPTGTKEPICGDWEGEEDA